MYVMRFIKQDYRLSFRQGNLCVSLTIVETPGSGYSRGLNSPPCENRNRSFPLDGRLRVFPLDGREVESFLACREAIWEVGDSSFVLGGERERRRRDLVGLIHA